MAVNYRIGVIGDTGHGNYGHGVGEGWLHIDGTEIVGVADPDEAGRSAAASKLKAPRAFADYRKMLDELKPDIVSICPRWLDQHHDMVLAAAERKIHVYMEKPMCRTLEEADRMVAACEKNKVKLAMAYPTRYSPKLPVIRNMIEDGVIGRVLELRGRGKEDRRGGGEDLWVLGSHIFNLMHFFGGEPYWCFSRLLQDNQPVTKEDVVNGAEGIGKLAGDGVSAMYGMDESVTGFFGTQRNTAGGRFALQIRGSRGIIEIVTGYLPQAFVLEDPMWSPGRSGKKWVPISSAGAGREEPIKEGSSHMGNVAACTDLLVAIEEERQPEASIYEGRTTVEMIAGVFESHRQGGPVKMPLENRKNPLSML